MRHVLLPTLGAAVAFLAGVSAPSEAPPEFAPRDVHARADSLRGEVDRLEAALARRAPRGAYLVVDRGNNRLWLRDGAGARLEAVVSTGSGAILRESGGEGRSWTFDTPAGQLRVLAVRPSPVWVKPDWAFLEEGLQPPPGLAGRLERGSLGEWALDLGDGYMIHGTLYERLLGRSLTHGCIRVGRDDLRAVVEGVRPGTPVFIF
ncbi:MAG TPA: L,D-transpeptidase [Longimicrobiales bacterium]